MNYMLSFTTFLLIAASVEIQAFTTPHHQSLHTTGTSSSPKLLLNKTTKYQQKQQRHQNQYQQYNPRKTGTHLSAEDESSNNEVFLSLSKSDQTVVGGIGIVTSTIMLWSEYVLKTTGCGLPAGPFGLLGAAEGLSYLGVIGLVSFSILTKIKTGSGLPAGEKGILGAAEGLAFLAVFAGIIVLVLQVTNYGYIPNAVPMEGGMCQ